MPCCRAVQWAVTVRHNLLIIVTEIVLHRHFWLDWSLFDFEPLTHFSLYFLDLNLSSCMLQCFKLICALFRWKKTCWETFIMNFSIAGRISRSFEINWPRTKFDDDCRDRRHQTVVWAKGTSLARTASFVTYNLKIGCGRLEERKKVENKQIKQRSATSSYCGDKTLKRVPWILARGVSDLVDTVNCDKSGFHWLRGLQSAYPWKSTFPIWSLHECCNGWQRHF